MFFPIAYRWLLITLLRESSKAILIKVTRSSTPSVTGQACMHNFNNQWVFVVGVMVLVAAGLSGIEKRPRIPSTMQHSLSSVSDHRKNKKNWGVGGYHSVRGGSRGSRGSPALRQGSSERGQRWGGREATSPGRQLHNKHCNRFCKQNKKTGENKTPMAVASYRLLVSMSG